MKALLLRLQAQRRRRAIRQPLQYVEPAPARPIEVDLAALRKTIHEVAGIAVAGTLAAAGVASIVEWWLT